MSGEPNNPQAFPMAAKDRQGTMSTSSSEGMTLRDYYAAHCPITLIDAMAMWKGPDLDGKEERDAFLEFYALIRFDYAEAMLKEGEGL